MLIVFHTLKIFCCCQTQNGISPVYAASKNGDTEVVELLVQAGADINLATTDEVHYSTHTVSSSVAAVMETNVRLIEFVVYDLHFHWSHPKERKYALLTLDVHASVCVSVKSHLTSQMSNRTELAYLVAYERQRFCGDLSEMTGFNSYAAKPERRSQYTN